MPERDPGPTEVATHVVDRLTVRVYATTEAMAEAAARSTAHAMRALAAEPGGVPMVFASAPSQTAFLRRLATLDALPWARTTAFHLDEYVGLAQGDDASFARFLHDELFGRVPLAAAHLIDAAAPDVEAECRRYAALLAGHPLGIACIGIGENGHIAFNEPNDTDFDDPRAVRTVELDPVSRQQQVRDGCFATLDAVPTHAITLTVPAIMAARSIRCIVPGRHKAEAVLRTLRGPVEPACPASVLRTHADAELFLDAGSGALVGGRLGASPGS